MNASVPPNIAFATLNTHRRCATDAKAAVEAVDRIYRPGFKYSKAEVLLVNLCQKGEYTEGLFSISQPLATEKVMGVLDAINGRWGRGTMRLASVPTNPDWGMRREMMSQSFTTRVDQL
jgi:DNA polymerase V